MVDVPGTQDVSLTPNTQATADVMFDSAGSFIPQNVIRTNGAPVDTAHPFPVLDGAAVTQLGFLVSNAVSSLTQLTQQLAAQTAIQTNTSAIGSPTDAAWSGSGPGSLIAIEKALVAGGSGGGSATAANQVTGNTSLATIATSQGTQGTSLNPPSGGSGILGFLSGIYNSLTGAATSSAQTTGNNSLATIATNSASAATATGQTSSNTLLSVVATNTTGAATAANQATEITSLGTIATAQGAQGTSLNPPTGGSGVLGYLSGAYSALTAPLTAVTPDVRATGQTIASGTLNAAYTTAVNNGASMVGYTISGLTASGATLTAEYSNDGTTWTAHNFIAGTFTSTATADGQYTVNASGHVSVRLRVSVIGTGTITVASNITVADSLAVLGASLPTGANTIGAVNINGTVPVSGTVSTTLSAGSAAIGTVGVTALPALPAGTNAIGLVTSSTPDVRALSQTINSATASAAVSVTLNNGAAVVGWIVTGLTASGATLTSEYTNDGFTWAPHNIIGATFVTTLTADGQFIVNAASHVGVRLRVTSTGTGTLTISYNTSIAASVVNLGSSIPTGANTIGSVNIIGTVPVSGSFTQSGAIPAGSNAIGTVGVTALPSIPAGSNAIGTVGVTALPALAAGSNAIGSVTLGGTLPAFASTPAVSISGTLPAFASTPAVSLSGTLPAFASTPAVTVSGTLPAFAATPPVSLVPTTSGGTSFTTIVSAASNNLTTIKSSAGQLYGAHIESIAAAGAAYLKFYNGSPTMGTTNCVDQIALPAAGSSSGTGHEFQIVNGAAYSSGIYIAITGSIALNDNTPVAASAFNATIYWK